MPQPITVTVNNGQVSVSPDPVSIGRGEGRNVQLRWRIGTPGWSFPANGIVIKNNNGEFSNDAVADQGTGFFMDDHNDRIGSYPYTVNVTNGQQTLTLDPTIINRAEE
jgi:hypothetical protein